MPPSARLSPRKFFALKAALFAASLLPAAVVVAALFFSDNPPAEPVDFLTRETGESALRFLIITLAMTPLRLLTGRQGPLQLRRMFGLFAFFYAACHFSVYLFLDLQLDFSLAWDDVVKRKYITVGAAALLLLIPLAATSNQFSVKKMGFAAWQKLHRAVYAISVFGAVHFLWLKKGEDIGEPLAYLFIILLLLATRPPPMQKLLRRARR
ncbi:MAG: sulfite oxidase heme-binding subunit YedZ [Gammaproteobacteria bacterium]